jgi:hypothetical protein
MNVLQLPKVLLLLSFTVLLLTSFNNQPVTHKVRREG